MSPTNATNSMQHPNVQRSRALLGVGRRPLDDPSKGEDLQGIVDATEVLEESVPACRFENTATTESAGPPAKRQRRAPATGSVIAASAASAASSASASAVAVAAAHVARGEATVTMSRAHLQAIVDALDRAARCAAHAVHICRAARDGFEDRLGTVRGVGDSAVQRSSEVFSVLRPLAIPNFRRPL